MNELEEGAARAQIRNTIAIYNNAADRGRIDDVLNAFAEDALYELPGRRMEGHQQIFDFLSGVVTKAHETAAEKAPRGAAAVPEVRRHHLTTQRIEFTSESEADAWTYFFTMNGGRVFEEGIYVDRLARTPKGWKIRHRRVKLIGNAAVQAAKAS